MTLFQGQLIDCMMEERLQHATSIVDRWSLNDLNDPALAGRIESVWTQYRPDIPVLLRAEKYGERRELTRAIVDHGREIMVTDMVLDVRVPFRGDPQMFGVRPSTSSILNERVNVAGGELLYTMPFDPSQESQFEKMLDQIEQNLGTLRQEEQRFSQSANTRLRKAADERRARLAADEKTAGAFSFKVK